MSGLSSSFIAALGPQPSGLQSSGRMNKSTRSTAGMLGGRRAGNFKQALRNVIGAQSASGKAPVLSGVEQMPQTKAVSDAQALLLALSVREVVAEMVGKRMAAGKHSQQEIEQDQKLLQALSNLDQALSGAETNGLMRRSSDGLIRNTETPLAGESFPGGAIEQALERFLNGGDGVVSGLANVLSNNQALVDTLAQEDCKLCQYLSPRMKEGQGNLTVVVRQLERLLARLRNGNPALPIGLPDETSKGPILKELFSATSVEQTGMKNAVALESRPVPDLIYIGDTKSAGARLLSPEAAGVENVMENDPGRFRLLLSPSDSGSRPAEALQTLINRLEDLNARGIELGKQDEKSGKDLMLNEFLAERLDPRQMQEMSRIDGMLVQSEVREAAMAESVRQVQAMMADMAERMQGQVLMDTENLRAVMHLEPPVLGRVHVALQVGDDGQVVAHVAADQSATQDFLEQNESELRQGLAGEGFDPEDIELVFDEDISHAFGEQLRHAAVV